MYARLKQEQIINNEKREAKSTYHGVNPSTEKPLWEVPAASESDLNDAVIAANNAFITWSKLAPKTRSGLMETFAKGLEQHKRALTELLNREIGKPV